MIAQTLHSAALASALAVAATGAFASPPAPQALGERPFLVENQRAMDKMMEGMAPKPTGDVDADFAAMMIPHHQGAIDMAVLELRYGRNEHLRRIAQEIIVDQQQEIGAMRLALGLAPPISAPAPTQGDATSESQPTPMAGAGHHPMMDMSQ